MSRRFRADEAQVSLFPFLAVLLCTMGTLVVVFVLVAQKTTGTDAAPRLSGAEESAANVSENGSETAAAPSLDDEYAAALVRTNAAPLDEIRSETESLDWFRDELDGVRTRSRENLDKERERLANAEKAVAKLVDDLSVLQRKLDALQANPVAESSEDASSVQGKIAETDVEIERLRAEIERLRAENANPKRSFAIVPYQGKKGTFRRPIFIECNERGVFLQPENVPFEPSDFILAKYPGNPFDAGVRAAARRLLETGGEKTASGDSVEPYPLLIVRPGGASSYYPAVAALASWGGVYGYEFVADDEEIAYPEPDPALAVAVREQAELARVRLQGALSEATSIRRAVASNVDAFRSGGGTGEAFGAPGPFGGSPGFGESGLPVGGLQARLGGQARLGAAGAKVAEVPAASAGDVVASGGLATTRPDGPSAAESLAVDATPLPRYTGKFSNFVVDSANVAKSAGPAVRTTATAAENASSADGTVAEKGASPNDSTPAFLSHFQAPNPSPAPSGAAKIDPRQTLGNAAFAVGATGTTDSGTLAPGAGEVGAPSTRIVPTERDEKSKRDDETAYANSQTERKAIRLSDELRRPATAGVERGVSVRCFANRLVFPKQPGLRVETTVVPTAGASLLSKETELLDALVLCVKSWGVAGRNLYWAPFLKVDVAPDGEERFLELSEFCRTQGLPIVRTDAGGAGGSLD